MTRLSGRSLAVVGVVLAGIAAGLVGGAGTGYASTSFNVSVLPLIGASAGDPVPQVSYGGKIGYEVSVQNTSTSNATHVQVVVDVPAATFVDATDSSCAAAKADTSEMICIPNGGTLNAGSTYTADFRFTAPTSGSSVTATPSVTIAAQTQGGKQNGNNGTTVTTGSPVTVDLNADGSTNDTYLRHNENASAGGPENFSTQLPDTLLGGPFGLELGIHNETGTPICPTCLPVDTSLTIPAASLVGNAGNPFYDGTTFNPYGWTMNAAAPTSFKLTGVFHIDDNGIGTNAPIPACANLAGLGPTIAFPVCYDTLTSKNKAGVQTLTATGRGLENGKVGFG
jgi:uncharacterized repeat protein (TIGR01451 family)